MALEPRATEIRLGNIPLKGSDIWKYSQDPTLFLHVGTTVYCIRLELATTQGGPMQPAETVFKG